ncbi:MAG TPA: hybrid sensor histidine kinase/response regulator [Verrucomicrobiae bacterium]
MSTDFNDMSMFDLFRMEAESQTLTLTNQLLALEQDARSPAALESAMRAAHSLKGAGRIIGLDAVVAVAHNMEDCLVAAQNGKIVLEPAQIDDLLGGVDLLNQIANTKESEQSRWTKDSPEVTTFVDRMRQITSGKKETPKAEAPIAAPVETVKPVAAPVASVPPSPVTPTLQPAASPAVAKTVADKEPSSPSVDADRALRVTAANLNRLLGLAAQTRIDSRQLPSQIEACQRLRRSHDDIYRLLENMRLSSSQQMEIDSSNQLGNVLTQISRYREQVIEQLTELDALALRLGNHAERLYHETLSIRMRPFADGTQGYPRLVRDISRQLGKEVQFELRGGDTTVDREVLEKLEAPLTQLLRNALDHGMETPSERQSNGKSPSGIITLEARHHAGRLEVTVSDDGRGIDHDRLRATVAARGLSAGDTVKTLSEAELLEFLFLPGFSMKEHVTEISGRGVGLDVVRNTLRDLRGTIRIVTALGKGTRFILTLPLTLSIVRVLLVEVAGEKYAFPLANLQNILHVSAQDLQTLEGRTCFTLNGTQIGLLSARQVLELDNAGWPETLSVIVIGSGTDRYGLVMDKVLCETELVVQPLDPRLGKVQDIASGALTEEGEPVLIFDVEDLLRTVERLVGTGSIVAATKTTATAARSTKRRILVVDDSLTVRELERKLLLSRGYHVEVAVDGMDGWNAVRSGHFDLVLTDVDMPRMNGIELVTLIKRDNRLRDMPVMIVSYKDREEDRRAGLEAGADYYLTKGSFHDDTLLQAVSDLIGEANA